MQAAEQRSISLPKEILIYIFSLIPFCGSDWLNIKLVTKRWLELAEKAFDPNSCRALKRMVKTENRVAISRLLDDERCDAADHGVALRFFCYRGDVEMVNKVLVMDRIDPSSKMNRAFETACLMGHLSIVTRLMQDARIDPSSGNGVAMVTASEQGNVEVVRKLLEDGRVDPNAQNHLSIRLAAKHHHWGVVELLMADERVDPYSCENVVEIVTNYGPGVLREKMLMELS